MTQEVPYAAAVSAIREELAGVFAVYLFGSRARGEERRESDVDLAILDSRPIDPVRRWHLQERLAELLHIHVDLVDLRAASTVMRVQVVDAGRLLLDRDPAGRGLFEASSLGAYARLNEERRGILEDIRKTGRVHG
ncbi:MAG: nucleotidyltransferase domain-containing protein [Myxococcales bacterium]|nr:nucleotidyltransferase domain-containing protein [Myxococcales bacterium]